MVPNDWLLSSFSIEASITLNDGKLPTGTHLTALGENCFNEDSIFHEQCDTEGVIAFDSVKRDIYDITFYKPGYQALVFENFYLRQDTTLSVELLLGNGSKPIDFEVDTVTSSGSWGLPDLKNNQNQPLSLKVVLNDELIATLPPDQHTYTFESLEPGTKYTAQIFSVYDWGDSFPSEFKWTTGIVGVDEIFEDNSISIFPNPASTQLNIQSEVNIEQITLINLVGQAIFEEQANSTKITLSTSELETGIYFVKVKTTKGVVNKRIVIQ